MILLYVPYSSNFFNGQKKTSLTSAKTSFFWLENVDRFSFSKVFMPVMVKNPKDTM